MTSPLSLDRSEGLCDLKLHNDQGRTQTLLDGQQTERTTEGTLLEHEVCVRFTWKVINLLLFFPILSHKTPFISEIINNPINKVSSYGNRLFTRCPFVEGYVYTNSPNLSLIQNL